MQRSNHALTALAGTGHGGHHAAAFVRDHVFKNLLRHDAFQVCAAVAVAIVAVSSSAAGGVLPLQPPPLEPSSFMPRLTPPPLPPNSPAASMTSSRQLKMLT